MNRKNQFLLWHNCAKYDLRKKTVRKWRKKTKKKKEKEYLKQRKTRVVDVFRCISNNPGIQRITIHNKMDEKEKEYLNFQK
jgi:hypothetical protein